MNTNGEKFVDFNKWCETCRFKDQKSEEVPCCDCLDHAVNTYSTKPLMWKEKEAK